MPARHWIRGAAALLLVAITLPALAGRIPDHDLSGSHDSKLVSRFPGSTIIGYRTVDYDQATLPTGKFDTGTDKLTKSETVAGKITDVAYAVPANKSVFAVYHNYAQALKQAGFVTRFSCHDRSTCGDPSAFRAAFAPASFFSGMAVGNMHDYNLMASFLDCNNSKIRYQTARLTRSTGNIDVSLLVCGSSGYPSGVLLQVIRAKPMKTGQITVDAKAMGNGLAQKGHIALYGIHFATDSAKLTPASNDTLAQMVKLLKAKPDLKVYIVGHTDSTGRLQHNLALSRDRAASVVKALEKRGIEAARMKPEGVASFAPVASNASAAGRAKNRRVELVQQ